MNLQKYVKKNGVCCATCDYVNIENRATCRIGPIQIAGYDELLSSYISDWPEIANADEEWCAQHPQLADTISNNNINNTLSEYETNPVTEIASESCDNNVAKKDEMSEYEMVESKAPKDKIYEDKASEYSAKSVIDTNNNETLKEQPKIFKIGDKVRVNITERLEDYNNNIQKYNGKIFTVTSVISGHTAEDYGYVIDLGDGYTPWEHWDSSELEYVGTESE